MTDLLKKLDEWEKDASEHDMINHGACEERILTLIDLVRKKDEALSSVTKWFDRMHSDHWEKTSKSFEDACKNWPDLLQEPLDMLPIKEALALTEDLK